MPHRSEDEALGLTERFRQRLRERRLPVTRQRLAIAGMVFRAEDHPSVLELEHRLRAAGESIGTATLYRTLEVLVDMGLVREQDFGEGYTRYEPAAPAPHDHLICERCGRVVEFDGGRLERMLRITADEEKFQYRRHRIDVHGLCHACRGRDLGPMTGESR
ncbi:MAG TPA: transcriptional repressor [Gemmatimonadales bacterium]